MHDLITLFEACIYSLHSCLLSCISEMDVSIYPPKQTLKRQSYSSLSEVNHKTEVLKLLAINCSEGSGKKGEGRLSSILKKKKSGLMAKKQFFANSSQKNSDEQLRASGYKTRIQAKKGNLVVVFIRGHPNKRRRMLMKLLTSTTGAIILTGSCWGTSINLTSARNVAKKAMSYPGDS